MRSACRTNDGSVVAGAARVQCSDLRGAVDTIPLPPRREPWTMAGLTVAAAVERVAEELGLGESGAGGRRLSPKAVASAALEQLALPRVEGEGLKAQLGRILQELEIASGWELTDTRDAVSSDARLCLLAIGGWDSQFQRLRRVDALEWSATGCPAPAWHSLPELLAARCGSAACVAADGAVIVVGGMGEKSAEVSHIPHQHLLLHSSALPAC